MTPANKIINQDEIRRINYEIREDLEEFLCDNIYDIIDTYNEDEIRKSMMLRIMNMQHQNIFL